MLKVYLEGSKGADYIKITQNKVQERRSCCNIEVGHCCVVRILKSQVPIEFITSLFCNFMLFKSDGNSRSINDKLSDFAGEVLEYEDFNFIKERLSRIKDID